MYIYIHRYCCIYAYFQRSTSHKYAYEQVAATPPTPSALPDCQHAPTWIFIYITIYACVYIYISLYIHVSSKILLYIGIFSKKHIT